jgi:hypothetical protein
MQRGTSTSCLGNGAAVLAALAVWATASGCASPVGQGLADFRARREIERVAADDSFPSAAEAGLTMSEATSTEGG